MSTSQSKQNFTAIAIAIIIGLLGLNGYQWYNNSKISTESNDKNKEILELQRVQVELDQDYQAAIERLDEMKGENEQLNLLIENQKNELRDQKEKINGLIWTKKELEKAKSELSLLNQNAKKYIAEIEDLRSQNQALSDNNQQLTLRIEEEIKAKEQVVSEKEAISEEKNMLSKSNEALSSKVDMAKTIKVNYVDIKGYEVSSKGKLSEKSRAKNVDLVRVCFLTETNLVAESGKKRFYVRIISPQGQTLSVEDNGGGVLTNKMDNTQVRYTISGDINYNNEDTNACIDWQLTDQLVKGEYKVEVYNNGFLAGKGAFSLK